MSSFKLLEKITVWAKLTKQVFCKHLRTLYSDLDQVQEIQNYNAKNKKVINFHTNQCVKSTTYDYQYIVPITLGTYVLIDCLIIMVHNGGYSHLEMPQLFTHLISPPELWRTTDVSMGLGFLMFPLIYDRLLLCPKLSKQYQIILQVRRLNAVSTIKMYCNNKCKLLRKLIINTLLIITSI